MIGAYWGGTRSPDYSSCCNGDARVTVRDFFFGARII